MLKVDNLLVEVMIIWYAVVDLASNMLYLI